MAVGARLSAVASSESPCASPVTKNSDSQGQGDRRWRVAKGQECPVQGTKVLGLAAMAGTQGGRDHQGDHGEVHHWPKTRAAEVKETRTATTSIMTPAQLRASPR